MTGDPTALLLLDVQEGNVTRYGSRSLLDNLVRAARVARTRRVPVVHVRLGFRAGHPEVSRANRMFAPIVEAGRYAPGDTGARIHPALGPENGDLVVEKRRVSAFSGSDLEVLLRGLGVRSLVLAGIATSGVVLSTLREAADRDYRLTVLADACADRDAEVHRVLLEKVFPSQSDVVATEEWIGSDGPA